MAPIPGPGRAVWGEGPLSDLSMLLTYLVKTTDELIRTTSSITLSRGKPKLPLCLTPDTLLLLKYCSWGEGQRDTAPVCEQALGHILVLHAPSLGNSELCGEH